MGWGLSTLAISFLIVVAFLAYSLNSPPVPGVQGGASKTLPLSQFRVLSGGARIDDNAISFNRYQQYADAFHGLAVRSGPLEADQYAYLRYQVQATWRSAEVSLTWRRKDNPEEIFRTHLTLSGQGWSFAKLSDVADWRGSILELGIHVVSDRAENPVTVAGLVLEPWSLRRELTATVSQWLAFRGWTHRSLNYLRGHPGEEAISPMPYAAAWAALAALGLVLVHRLGGRVNGTSYAVVFFVPWIAVDLLWQRELLAQLEVTKNRFQGKTMEQKHLADEDSAIYSYVQRLKRDVLPDDPVRIFIADDSRGHDYERLKAQYYLLPNNIYNFGSGASRPAIRRGDYLLVLAGNDDPAFVADESRLIWERGRRVRAQEVDVDEMGRLYLLTDRSLRLPRDE